jgi:zinc protease
MAFNGTEHFPKNELIEYLEGIGAKFGAHLNAHTSFEETVYKLQVPTDDPEIVDKGFLVLRDWAGALAFEDEEMAKERGVVLEEWRRSRGAGGRARDVLLPLYFYGARQAERLPIGTEEVLKSFEHDAARRFYADWYRPDLMAVFVVGDIDADAMQAKIESTFADLTGPESPRERIQYEVPEHPEDLYGVHADPEQRYSSVVVMTKRKSVEGGTIRDYREVYVARMATAILGERLGDIIKQPDAPFLNASLRRGRMTPVAENDFAFAVVPEGGIEAGLEALLVEVERLKRHGVTEAELDRAKANAVRNMEKGYRERDKEASRRVLRELLRHFTNGETVPGTAWEWEAVQRYVPDISVEEVNRAAASLLTGSGLVVGATVPAKEGSAPPTEEALKAVVARVASMDIDPPVAEEVLGPLLSSLPTPGSIVSEERDEANDVDVWTLSNGITVLVKTTDFKADEIRIRGYAFGGHSLATDEEFVPAKTINSITRASGVGPFTAAQLGKWLSGKSASVHVGIGETRLTASATTRPKDLEVAMQLLYAKVTAGRLDEDGFQVIQKSQTEYAANRDADPNTPFMDAYKRLLWGDHPRSRPWTVDTYALMDLEASRAFHAKRMANWGGAVFGIVGNVDLDALRPLVAQYLATLPAGTETFADVGERRAEGVHLETIVKGLEPKARVRMTYSGEFESTPENRHAVRMLGKLLSMRLREVLREDLGGTYSVRARVNDRFHPVSDYGITIDFQCDPERVEELETAAMDVVDEVLSSVSDADFAARIAEQERRQLEENLRSNSFWLGALTGNRRRGEAPEDLALYWSLHEKITPEYLHAAATEYIDRGRMVKVILLPEGAPE